MDGDVGFFANSIPKVFWKGEFVEICGDGFWNNHYGAAIFCKKLGYETGVIRKSSGQDTSTVHSLFIGACAASDTDLSACTGGHNTYSVAEHSQCTKRNTYEIECSGGDSPKSLSCEGKGAHCPDGENPREATNRILF